MDYQRQLLAELMNPLIPSAKKDYRDADVCKHFLVAFCPNEMFLNTKVDLGKCGLLHDERLQKEYQDSPDRGRHNYEQRFYDYLTKLVSDIERTIRKGHLRLENKSGEPVGMSQDDTREKIIIMEETIKSKIQQLQKFGESGRIKDAFDLYSAVERTMLELESMRQNDQTHPTYRPDKKMEVCDICGALLANDSTGQRIDAHLTGKQHTGFVKIRDTVEEHRKNGGTVRNYTNGSSISNRDYRDRDRDRDRDYNSRDRDRDRGGRRDSDRDRGGRRDSASDRRGSGSGTGRDSGSSSYRDGRRY
ncbi:hypothetical protein BASA50_003939 [Batrachochytrium salamandrivorans]|uniref:U1-type domain-containing protein n=1 Tax=Batrachochytrium salamandrivorans TaxID=1357716 RepID=A0ABQ8FGR8_9FUNG|nr:hypothetical protein BASA60_002862 [Batrachochytrium salamandrivorans]KAH6598056.1 hypothetical protein BASA50_003939 [Batrachochytrium salamandrivorans]KAH9272506.1 hypothetical protein BASA83_005315 [Batrachochytrium salamandrivorans]